MKNRAKTFRIGTLNCRGLKTSITKPNQLADDMKQYQLDMMAIQETHLDQTDTDTITTTDGTSTYTLHLSGKEGERRTGVGIVVRRNIDTTFTPISDRICMCKTTIPKMNRNIVFICAYAPTLPVSESTPGVREAFYQQLESVINKVSNMILLYIGGDFNAQTGIRGNNQFKENMGKYSKGQLNSNGEALLQLASRNSLLLTNTIFQHKLSHITTWEAPYRKIVFKDGSERINPIRNQIDYILTRRPHRGIVTNSRSYSGTHTFTDHRLVRTTITVRNFGRKVMHSRKIAFERLKDPITRARYSFAVEMRLMDKEYLQQEQMKPQQSWDAITEANRQAAIEVIGYRDHKKTDNTMILQKSREQKELGSILNSTQDPEQRANIRKARNQKLTEIHELMKNKEQLNIIDHLREIENSKDDSGRMYKAVKAIQQNRKRKPLQIETGDGITAEPTAQARIITEHFKSMFTKEDIDALPNIPPHKMNPPFTRTEVEKAVKALKNNKSAGADEIKAEQLKYGPTSVYDSIADIFNTLATTGECPKEVKEGLLLPLQKPGKAKGPPSNLRPIILLSMLRKILATCMLWRIGGKIDENIPFTQAAYRAGRGTTEQLFALKVMAEKAIRTTNFETHILMMDMSRAFDTVNRKTLMQDLRSILDPGELHIIKVMTEDVRLIVDVDGNRGKPSRRM